MKTILLSVGLLLSPLLISQISDSVTIEPGYTNQSYYNLANGEVVNIANNDWDLAFDLSGFGSTIRINGSVGTELFVASNDTTNWATIDTAGMNAWTQVFDSDTSWSNGAFNKDSDFTNPFDLGWGLYNSTTHFITGHKLYVIRLADGSVKKIWIKRLAGGNYTFSLANLDNTDMITETISKSAYSGKNFVYYAIDSQSIVDREPLSESWDIVFTKYVSEIAPNTHYGVTGVLHNHNTSVYEATGAPASALTFSSTYQFDTKINAIGYDWKTYSFSQGGFVLDDSLAYFIETTDGSVWKLIFTDFAGSSTGEIMFTKEQIAFATVVNSNTTDVKVFPNPTVNHVTISSGSPINSLSLLTVSGQVVVNQTVNQATQAIFELGNLSKGIYILTIELADGTVQTKKINKQ